LQAISPFFLGSAQERVQVTLVEPVPTAVDLLATVLVAVVPVAALASTAVPRPAARRAAVAAAAEPMRRQLARAADLLPGVGDVGGMGGVVRNVQLLREVDRGGAGAVAVGTCSRRPGLCDPRRHSLVEYATNKGDLEF
jgi:hypothetical protein